ncbi:MAG: Undecaprenyl-phosphate galactose phosphotransferase [Candidatus Angelobacter sp.]|nr:Undecaprenyl-phosphate galactose phosphotransferase [Candidatus Angelobacter sp.]
MSSENRILQKQENVASSAAFARAKGLSLCGFLPEHQFTTALCVERRRSERTGNPFLLALVHLDATQTSNGCQALSQKALCSVLRDTDAAGWYKTGKTMGVILTCLAETTKDVSKNVINARLGQALCGASAGAARNFRITYHFFPESNGNGSGGDSILYPEPGDHQFKRAGRLLKRIMDVSGSLLALSLLCPVMLLVAASIKVTSKGPVLFMQKRVGQGERIFTFLKFRSMHHNNDHSLHREFVTRLIAGQPVALVEGVSNEIYKIINDPRMTPIGRLLRRSSLDELPQLVNVLKGEMSLVGPRPPVPYEVERYSSWHRRRIMEVKPGITGLWQVNGRSRTTFDEMVRLDLEYVRSWSIWLDLKILLRTPTAVLSGEGAY